MGMLEKEGDGIYIQDIKRDRIGNDDPRIQKIYLCNAQSVLGEAFDYARFIVKCFSIK